MTQVNHPSSSLPRHSARLAVMALLLSVGAGCGSSLAQPFDQLKSSGAPVTIYRLQNYEPPTQQAAASPTNLLPPQLQQWVQGAVNLLPPGLLPPGLIPGTAPAPAHTANEARFHNFRILGWLTLNDSSTIDEVYEIFGKDKSFTSPSSTCLYPEFGFSFAGVQGQPNNDILVSLSCNNTQTFNFAWPHGTNTGLTNDSTKRIIEVAKKSFGG